VPGEADVNRQLRPVEQRLVFQDAEGVLDRLAARRLALGLVEQPRQPAAEAAGAERPGFPVAGHRNGRVRDVVRRVEQARLGLLRLLDEAGRGALAGLAPLVVFQAEPLLDPCHDLLAVGAQRIDQCRPALDLLAGLELLRGTADAAVTVRRLVLGAGGPPQRLDQPLGSILWDAAAE
jgi:hypothetical protein